MPPPTQAPHIANLMNTPYNPSGMNQLRPMTYNQQPPFEQSSPPQNARPYQSTLPPPGSPDDGRASKRVRVSRACDTCRRKKIRCDFDNLAGAHACTTCVNAGWDCTFNEVAKKRGPPKGYIDSLEDRLKKMERLLENIAQSGNPAATAALRNGFGPDDSEVNETSVDEESSPPLRTATRSASSDHQSQAQISPPVKSDQMVIAPESPKQSEMVDGTMRVLTVPDPQKVCKYIGGSAGIHLFANKVYDAKTFGTKKIFFPDQSDNKEESGEIKDGGVFVVREQYDHEHARDLENAQLDMKGAMPPKDLVDLLIKTFFEESMINCPIIDQKEFMDAFEGRTTPPPSRMLMNAMFCVACRHLQSDHPVLTRHKLDSKRLYKLFTDRAAIAFTRQYFSPNVSTIQSLLLVISNPNFTAHGNPNWIWCGMVIRMAQDIGFHRCNGTFRVSPAQEDFARKLWWSTYITDRWTCAMLGGPLGISDADVDTEKPEANNEKDETFLHFIKLSEIVGEVLRRLYSAKAKAMGYGRKEVENVTELLRGMLLDWRKCLPERLNITDSEIAALRSQFSAQLRPDKAYAEKGPFMLYYFAVVILLNRPFIISGPIEHDNEASRRCTEAAKSIVDVARVVRIDDLMHFGHTAALTVMQAAFIHLYNAAKTTPKISADARKYLTTSQKIFAGVCSRWPDAPPIMGLIGKLQDSVDKIHAKKELESLPRKVSEERPPVVPEQTPQMSETLFANWPIEQFVASLSDAPPIAYDKMETEAKQPKSSNIPFWGAPSGYDWQEWGNFLVEGGITAGTNESII
ncbi:fungal-specific transcription factor domain-containing protein [Umbelopsis sp. AD052]|nr:fungal-specific transcription factor domain-containing protein [Umbelopsis sp. AD052]